MHENRAISRRADARWALFRRRLLLMRAWQPAAAQPLTMMYLGYLASVPCAAH